VMNTSLRLNWHGWYELYRGSLGNVWGWKRWRRMRDTWCSS
jgi:hypothetical protein